MQQMTRDLHGRPACGTVVAGQPAPVAHAICWFVRLQQNCEKPIRAIVFCATGAGKSA
jgi:hypothetical protein